MADLILAAIGVSLYLYMLFGGADFGAGILELFLGERAEPYVDRALSPVWETNHVWLILAMVLCFVGFPLAFTTITTYLHLPLLLVLLGIVARGAAFTFRHYDPAPGGTRVWYNRVFRASSLLTPFFLGVTVAAISGGRLNTRLGDGFYAVFVAPWLGVFPVTLGVFVCSLCVFVATAFLAAERGKEAKGGLHYLRFARRTHLLSVVSGAIVLVAAWVDEAPIAAEFLASPIALTCAVLATILIPLIAWSFHEARVSWLRVAVSAQLALILAGYGVTQYPVLVRLADTPDITVNLAAAPQVTLCLLAGVLGFGLVLILPALFLLLRVYKLRQIPEVSRHPENPAPNPYGD
jgi:cytochrome d ubiquinol oxidase subunit II